MSKDKPSSTRPIEKPKPNTLGTYKKEPPTPQTRPQPQIERK